MFVNMMCYCVACSYIETIYKLLKPGGIWINLGPLLYHWVSDVESNEDPRYDASIELSYEELRHVIQTFNFEYLHESWHTCNYSMCEKSMMTTNYK